MDVRWQPWWASPGCLGWPPRPCRVGTLDHMRRPAGDSVHWTSERRTCGQPMHVRAEGVDHQCVFGKLKRRRVDAASVLRRCYCRHRRLGVSGLPIVTLHMGGSRHRAACPPKSHARAQKRQTSANVDAPLVAESRLGTQSGAGSFNAVHGRGARFRRRRSAPAGTGPIPGALPPGADVLVTPDPSRTADKIRFDVSGFTPDGVRPRRRPAGAGIRVLHPGPREAGRRSADHRSDRPGFRRKSR